MVSSSDVQFYPEGRLGLGSARAKQESSGRYSYGGANSHKSCVDQGDCWVIKLLAQGYNHRFLILMIIKHM